MKRFFSAMLAGFLLASVLAFTSNAANTNEPTTEDMEAVIKLVKPKLDVPESCSVFTWRFNAESAYSDASWRFTWSSKDDAEKQERVNVTCDADGNIVNFSYRDYKKNYGQLPDFTKFALEAEADNFIKKALPDAYTEVKLYDSYGSGIYAGNYTYHYVRYIGDYIFPDNYINVSVDFNTGKVVSLNVDFNYDIEIDTHETIISPEKAEEILGTRQQMNLTYLTKTDINEDTKERTIKAFLVYKPEYSYLAVDAGSGEIYDTKSAWSVNDSVTGGAGGVNSALKGDVVLEGAMKDEAEYELSEEELAGLKELEGLISKEEAIKAITQNKYLYINPSLTAVSANLNKNYNFDKTASYQNDNGSYFWYITFSNPVIDDKYYNYAYADATVNAQTGEIVSFNCNLNDYYYYSNNKLDIPDVKFDVDSSRKIAEDFLRSHAKSKFENSVEADYYVENIIKRTEHQDKTYENTYGAHAYRFARVNEGIKFDRNYINVGVDGVTGKIYSFNYNWWTNVEFESPKSIIKPSEALSHLLDNDGYGLIYERNMTYIYTPVTESSKRDVCVAFIASFKTTLEKGGDIDAVIEKYAKSIDREKLIDIFKSGDEDAAFEFVCRHFGVSVDEVQKTTSEYIDSGMFYDKCANARLVYTCYDLGSVLVSPFTGKLLTSNGSEYTPDVTSYTYNDLSGHWIENNALLLADIGIGFDGGSFKPDTKISAEEFVKLSQSMNFYTSVPKDYVEFLRIDAIKIIIDSLGYEKIAKLKNIYKTDFADNAEIKEDDIGYISIAFGFGIVKGDGTNVNAYSTLTRAEAVSLLLNAVKSSR